MEKHAGNLFDAAKDVYQNTFKGRYVKTKIGNVLMTGYGWQKLKEGLKKDIVRAKTIPFIPHVLSTTTDVSEESLTKERTDGIESFYVFINTVDVDDDLTAKVELKVGVRKDHSLVYYLRPSDTFDSINGKPPLVRCDPPNIEGVAQGSVPVTLDSTLVQDGQEINLIILKNTGQTTVFSCEPVS